mmetsp:Transcript_4314/g.10413  ORF Transcript_4314/g.10413 Transcript_4314/m.10413 type:complete len:95 (-) Transcript_4314:854-1138(-)
MKLVIKAILFLQSMNQAAAVEPFALHIVFFRGTPLSVSYPFELRKLHESTKSHPSERVSGLACNGNFLNKFADSVSVSRLSKCVFDTLRAEIHS